MVIDRPNQVWFIGVRSGNAVGISMEGRGSWRDNEGIAAVVS